MKRRQVEITERMHGKCYKVDNLFRNAIGGQSLKRSTSYILKWHKCMPAVVVAQRLAKKL